MKLRIVPRVLLLAAALVALGTTPAQAATTHHAAVIVETGSGSPHRVVITFGEDSITGIDALSRAGADPVVYSYAGQGGAVCRLFGVGRDAGPNCLGGQDGDNRYWAYFRAPAGSSAFTYSSVGAGTSRVHDGDVEGWRFGTGQAPQYVSLQSLLPPPSPPPSAAPATGGATNSAAAPGRAAAAVNPGAAPSPIPSSTLPVTGVSGATGAAATAGKGDGATTARGDGKTTDSKASRRAADADTALAASTHDDGGSSATSLIWFALLLVAIVAAVLLVRRVRRRPIP